MSDPTTEEIKSIRDSAPEGWTHYCTRNRKYFRRDGNSDRLFVWIVGTESWSVPLDNRTRWLERRERLEEILTLRQEVDRLRCQSEPKRWFTYCCDDGYQEHESVEAAKKYADLLVHGWLDDCWGEEVADVRMGIVTHQAAEGERTYPQGEIDEDGCDEAGEWWRPEWSYKVMWTLEPLSHPKEQDHE